ncbi:LysE family translocator, partial [Providencia vermicola]|nr:LysE family translocator [Providencia vermicola]
MNIENFLALSLFSFVTSITPGPNNIMLLASGVNFGFQKTLPHSLGVSIGFFIMLIAVGLGVGALI